MKVSLSTTIKLYEDLNHYHELAVKALREGDMDRHIIHGGQFHRTADRIERVTGTDPREHYVK